MKKKEETKRSNGIKNTAPGTTNRMREKSLGRLGVRDIKMEPWMAALNDGNPNGNKWVGTITFWRGETFDQIEFDCDTFLFLGPITWRQSYWTCEKSLLAPIGLDLGKIFPFIPINTWINESCLFPMFAYQGSINRFHCWSLTGICYWMHF